MAFFKNHWYALACLLCVVLIGMAIGAVLKGTKTPQGPPLPPDAEHVTLHQDPHVVTCFKAWTESPQGSCLVMVWSDGQVWRAYTDNPKSIRSWDLLAHVRQEETP